ncbi:Dabb family protein [Telluribacter sp. SYSU D00476]|uniref:Dabb family protein n=1 Tax=Telluribacter sp. SYSU D00476 TaxID=2811430 RepID=UPI001FF13C10|nr:Dabb family protein [Telluribacter sp. SYSU D00476]
MKNTSRRKFLKASALAGVGTTIATGAVAASTAAAPKKELFVHHVYFYLKNAGSAADKAKLMEGLEKLSKVPTIRMVHIGTPATTNRDVIERGYSISWLCLFDNLEEQEVYQKHPIHLKFVDDYSHLWEKVIVYDSVGPKRA